MRTRISCMITVMTVLLFASGVAWAQQEESSNTGSVTISGVGTTVDGEEARYQRYADQRSGVAADFDLTFDSSVWLANVMANTVGRRDQVYFAGIEQQGKFGVSFSLTATPIFYSERLSNPYTETSPGVLEMDLSVRQQLEAGTLELSDYLAGLSLSDGLTKRYTYLIDGFGYLTPDWEANVELKMITKSGQQPFFGSFGFSDVVEIAAPIDYRTTNVTAGTEWGNHKAMARVEYLGSWFNNDVQELTWDQPDVTADRSNATSRGRQAMWPSNTYQNVSGTGSVAFAGRSRLTGTVAAGVMDQNEALLPHTINSALTVIPLDRTSAEAEASTLFFNLNFTSRPTNLVRFKARYRYNNLDKKTPHFDGSRYIRMDYSVRSGGGDSEPYSVKKQNFDAEVALSPSMAASLFAGYGRDKADRTYRVIPHQTQNKFWVGFDSIGNQYFTLRTKYEYSTRDGEADLDILHEVHEREEMRHFDVANRNRSRFTADFSTMPTPSTGLNFSFAFGKDEFKADLAGSTIAQLGLLDNDHRIFTVGFNAAPSDGVFFDVYYVYENYNTFQRNQTANPGSQELDPNREWTDDGSENVNTFGFNLDAERVRDVVDLGFSWVYTDAESLYIYAVGSALPTPEAVPAIENKLNRFTADANFWVTDNIAIGIVYWFDKYDVQDIANDGGIGLTPNNGQYLGYFYEPYTAHTAWINLTYAWGN